MERYSSLAAKIRASGRSDAPWLELRTSVIRREPVIRRMQALHDQLTERIAVSSGWLNWRLLVLLLLTALLGPRLLGPRFLVVLAVIAVGVVAWRIVPGLFLMRDIRMLSEKL